MPKQAVPGAVGQGTESEQGEEMEQNPNTEGIPVGFLVKSLLFSYILTAVLLAILAFLLYKLGLDEKTVSVAIIAIYVAGTLFGGFVTGKKMRNRRFLWGLLMGTLYFLVLALVSLAVGKGNIQMGTSFFTTLALCAGGGMLGGMVS